jgi:hypothetical protein
MTLAAYSEDQWNPARCSLRNILEDPDLVLDIDDWILPRHTASTKALDAAIEQELHHGIERAKIRPAIFP